MDAMTSEFLDSWKIIEARVRDISATLTDDHDSVQFGRVVARVRQANSLPTSKLTLLEELAEYRNQLLHSERIGVVPSSETLALANSLVSFLDRPQLAMDAIKQPDGAVWFDADDSIEGFLSLVSENNFSQAPVYDPEKSEFNDMVTTNAFARWAAAQEGDLIGTYGVSIREVCSYREKSETFVHMSRNITLSDLRSALLSETNSGPAPRAAFISNSGVSTQKLLRIFTLEDLVELDFL